MRNTFDTKSNKHYTTNVLAPNPKMMVSITLISIIRDCMIVEFSWDGSLLIRYDGMKYCRIGEISSLFFCIVFIQPKGVSSHPDMSENKEPGILINYPSVHITTLLPFDEHANKFIVYY